MERVVLFKSLLVYLYLPNELNLNFLFLFILIHSVVKIKKHEIFLRENQTNLLNLNSHYFIKITMVEVILKLKPTLESPVNKSILLGLNNSVSKSLLEAYFLDLTFLIFRIIGRHLLY
jgi:hypothetical protein